MKKYLIDGQMVNLVEKTESGYGYVVQNYYTDYGDDCGHSQSLDEPRLILDDDKYYVENVYDNPPTQVFEKKILMYKQEISDLEKKRQTIANKVQEAERDMKERLERLKKFDELRYIDDFMEEKFTHIVVKCGWSGCPKIHSFDSYITYRTDGSCENGIKLLSLYGDKNKDLEWRLHRYSDGSGGYEMVYPFTSLAGAEEKVREILEKKLKEIENKKAQNKGYYVINLTECANENNFDLPEWVIDEYKKETKKIIKADLDKLKTKRKDIERDIKSLEAKL